MYFTAACDRIVECNAWTRDQCMVRIGACPDRLFAPGSGWTIDHAVQCSAEWATFDCDSVARALEPDCAVPNGPLAEGESCISDVQCQSGACSSKFTFTGECGECLPTVGLSEPCNPTVSCQLGQVCEMGMCTDTMPAMVQPIVPASLGQPCMLGIPCQEGLACMPATSGLPQGECVAAPALGEECAVDVDGDFVCAVGATCPRTEAGAICQALGEIGDECGWAQCVEGAYCNTLGDGFGTTHTCLAPRVAGDPCTRLTPFETETSVCAAGLECIYTSLARTEARCATPRDLGESCTTTDALCLPGTRCDAGVCVALEAGETFATNCP